MIKIFDLDIDLDEIEKIQDPTIKNIVSQLRINGFAVTKDNNISRKISKKYPKFRENENIIMAPDRRLKVNVIGFNPAHINCDKELEKFIKGIIKSFG